MNGRHKRNEMYYAEPVYRPPSEAYSLLVQATVGCSSAAAGRCFFCGICTGCDRCFIFCPDASILRPQEREDGYGVDSEHCKGCAVCEAVCPRGVIGMGEGS